MTSRAPDAPPLVLIVDDNPHNRKLARDVLGGGGLRTLEAATGAEAISLAAERLPDVVLLDLRLPDMDGADVARALGSRAPIVAMSAQRPDPDPRWLRETGFAGYLQKPISVRELPAQVRGYCGR